MKVHLIDGTYELFRHFFALPSHVNAKGQEVGAARGVLGSVLSLLEEGATHVAVATDHIIESFRNDLWPAYKDGSGIDPALFSQFGLLEDSLAALGVTVWAMVKYEADDALAAGAAICAKDSRVEQVLICTPDKDLAQCVSGTRVVQFDRRQRRLIDEAGVREKFGVSPASIPDYLALVGDAADGYPGIAGWGSKSAASILARYKHLEAIPPRAADWDVSLRGAARLAQNFAENRENAFLFRRLATLVSDGPVQSSVDDLRWKGPAESLTEAGKTLDAPALHDRARAATKSRKPS